MIVLDEYFAAWWKFWREPRKWIKSAFSWWKFWRVKSTAWWQSRLFLAVDFDLIPPELIEAMMMRVHIDQGIIANAVERQCDINGGIWAVPGQVCWLLLNGAGYWFLRNSDNLLGQLGRLFLGCMITGGIIESIST
jgi:hypothetical protein